MPGSDPLLQVSGLWKSYATPVLLDVAFDLHAGEVHALVGENGAGKTTLARILAGLVQPDQGHMTLRGRPYAPRTKREAQQLGVRLVPQELNLIGNLTVAENIFLDHLPHRAGWIQRRQLLTQARTLLEQVGLGQLDPACLVKTLGVGQQQLVEIAAGLSQRCAVLILDEPTAALSGAEVDRLFDQVARLKAAGTGIVYISHRLEEIQRIADRISVLRDGRMQTTQPASALTLQQMVRLMVGRPIDQAIRRRSKPPGPIALRVVGLSRPPAVRDVSFQLHWGEILGFAGLMGSGRTETMRALFGADLPIRGQIFLHGSSHPVTIRSPRDAVRYGLALLTEDRAAQGLLLPLPIRANLTLPSLPAFSRVAGWLCRAAERLEASRWTHRLGVRCHSIEQRVCELSGGNQQKVVVGKWLLRDCDILIFDEPTRGIDVGAKFDLYQVLDQLADRGKALIVVSSDLKELLALCDRIAVMSAGRLVATFQRHEFAEERILAAALSGYLSSKTHERSSPSTTACN
jgi:ribose transport system ATP-binding protein